MGVAICVFIEALAAFFATVMRFLGHSLLSSERSTLFGKMSLKTISIGCPNGEDHLEQLLHQTSTASLSSKTPSIQQTSFHSVHYLFSQINTITNDPSKFWDEIYE
ncbi:hypothetical protein NC651_007949 [Populus alba x Populus x berolinensis]|nr:hypothetical protein NC651_007949 [Populus alba x Populus x berolinensis]